MITFYDSQGNPIPVDQDQVGEMVKAGYQPAPGQTTLTETGKPISIETLADIYKEHGAMPRLELSRETFERGAEERFGGTAGGALATAYGAGQGVSGGWLGKGMMSAGVVKPETLAQLETAHPYLKGAGEFAGAVGLGVATDGLGTLGSEASLAARMASGAAREAAIGGVYGAGSEATQAGIEGRESNLGEAFTGGATLGGIVGGAVPLAGAGMAKIAERRLAAKEAKALGEGLSGERILADEALASKQTAIREGVADSYAKVAPAVDEYNNVIADMAERGVTLPNIEKKMNAIRDAIAKGEKNAARLGDDIGNLNSVEPFMREREAGRRAAADMKVDLNEALLERQGHLSNLTQEHDLLVKGQQSKAKIFAAEMKRDAVQAEVDGINKIKDLNDQFGIHQDELGALLKHQAGLEGERAGILGASENAAVETAKARAAALDDEKAALRSVGIGHSSDAGQVFARQLMQVSDDPAALKRTMLNALRVEKGAAAARGLVHDMLRQPGVISALNDVASLSSAVKLLEHGRGTIGMMRDGRRVASRSGKGLESYDQLIGQYKTKLASVALPYQIPIYLKEADGVFGRAIKAPALAQADAERLLATTKSGLHPVSWQAERVAARALSGPEAEAAAQQADHAVANSSLVSELDGQIAEAANQERVLIGKMQGIQAELRKTKEGLKSGKVSKRLENAKESLTLVQGTRKSLESSRENLVAEQQNRIIGRVETAGEAAKRQAGEVEASVNLAEARRLNTVVQKTKDLGRLNVDLEGKEGLLANLQALKIRKDDAVRGIETLKSEGMRFRKMTGDTSKLVPESQVLVENAKLAAFFKTPEGMKINQAIVDAGVKPVAEDSRSLAAALGSTAMHSIFGGGLITTLIGAHLGASYGKAGMRKAAEVIMNPIRWYGMVNGVLDGLVRTAKPIERMVNGSSSTHHSSPVEASAYVDSILADRRAMESAFDRLSRDVGMNSSNIGVARQRFMDAANFLERKRPPDGITNGSDANAFARSVSILRNPDLLAKFIKDGSVRQQDVEVMKIVAPEAYEQLKQGVALLHQERPNTTMPLAVAFGLHGKGSSKRSSMRFSLSMSQMMAAGAFGGNDPMVSKSETNAAQGRAPAKDSAVAESARADAGFGRDN